MRYKKDLAKFLPIADGARLIQERAGITEDEAREDIVLVLREGTAYFQFWRLDRNGRSWCQPGHLPHGFLNNLTSKDINWETSIACRRRVGEYFEVEIEVKRDDLSFLYPLLDDGGDRHVEQVAASDSTSHPNDGNGQEPKETRREKQVRETKEKYKRWRDMAQEIKGEGKWTRPTEIASAIAKREKGSGKRGVNAATIRRRLDKNFRGWAKRGLGKKTGAK